MIKRFFPIALVLALVSCDKKFNEVGSELLPDNSIQGKKAYFPVKVSHTLIDIAQTNAGYNLQLGERHDNLFGTTTAAVVSQFNLAAYPAQFGVKSAETESTDNFDEQETVTDVWLEIPFFTNQNDADGDGLIDAYDIDDTDPNSDSDGDGVSDIAERNAGTDPTNPDTDGDGIPDGEDTETENPNPDRKRYAIDSLFGNREATFDIEITKLNYFLRQLDPDNNFEQRQPYYSNFNIEPYKDEQIGSQNIQLNFDEIIVEGEDAQNLTPRLRVPLDKSFFQQYLLNNEGTTALSSPELWQDYFRSISIETSNFSESLLMLLNFNAMTIRIAYTYKAVKPDTDPEETEEKNLDYILNAGILKFNTITRTSSVSPDLNDIVSASESAQIALSGGLGSVATINLFEDDQDLDAIKNEAKNWMLNEANLTFYVDKQTVDQNELTLPRRLYLYNANTNAAILDFSQDRTASTTLNKLVYGGFLTEEDDKQYFKIRITDHFRNVIQNDSINVPLRLALADAFATQSPVIMAKVDNVTLKKVPANAVSAPKSAVFVGPNPTDPALENVKLQLEVFYTEID